MEAEAGLQDQVIVRALQRKRGEGQGARSITCQEKERGGGGKEEGLLCR